MSSNRILHIQKVAGIAGSEHHLLTLLPQLKDHGYEAGMLVLADPHDRPGCFVERMQAAGIPTRVIQIAGDFDPLLVPRLVRIIRQGRYDLVHTHLLHADIYGRLAARIARSKVISTYHCDDPFHLIKGIRLVDCITALMCSQIICISKAVREFVHNKLFVPLSRLNIVYYGFDLSSGIGSSTALRESLGIGQDASIIGIVARLTEQKGHIYLLQAMRVILDSISSVHLVIVGDGKLGSDLTNLAFQLGIKDRVHFLGFRADAANLIAEFDIFVLPSLFEGFGLVLLEAMAASKPIVATRISAIPEIVVDGETGLLVPPRDPQALAEAVLKLIANPDLAFNLGRCGRRLLEQRFTVEKMVEDTLRLYRAVIAS